MEMERGLPNSISRWINEIVFSSEQSIEQDIVHNNDTVDVVLCYPCIVYPLQLYSQDWN